MKAILLSFLLFLSLNALSAERLIDCDAIIVTKQNDTIRSRIIVKVISSSLGPKGEWISGMFFYNKIHFSITEKLEFVKSEEVRTLEFDLNGKKIVFISVEQVPEIGRKYGLCQQILLGKLSWYKSYSWENNTEKETDHLVLKGQKAYSYGSFSLLKNVLKKATKSRPDLLPMIGEVKGFWGVEADKGIYKVVTAFNETEAP